MSDPTSHEQPNLACVPYRVSRLVQQAMQHAPDRHQVTQMNDGAKVQTMANGNTRTELRFVAICRHD